MCMSGLEPVHSVVTVLLQDGGWHAEAKEATYSTLLVYWPLRY